MRTRISLLAPLVAVAALWLPAVAHAAYTPVVGDLIKLACPAGALADHSCRSVYYYGNDFKRYVFPNAKTYATWGYESAPVHVVTNDQMGAITIGGNVTYKAASKMVKITTDPTVYAVSKGGILRAIPSEAVAAAIYGSNWNRMIDDIPDAFFVNYKVGGPIVNAADYNKNRLAGCVTSINVDKSLLSAPNGCVDLRSATGFSSTSMEVPVGTVVTWIALDNGLPAVASDPHPTHTDNPDFVTTELPMGGSYSYTFSKAGTWKVHNHHAPDQRGTVTVK